MKVEPLGKLEDENASSMAGELYGFIKHHSFPLGSSTSQHKDFLLISNSCPRPLLLIKGDRGENQG